MTTQTCMWCSQESDTITKDQETPLCGCCMEHFSLPPDGPYQKHLDELTFPVLGIELYAGTRMITRVVNRKACSWLSKEPVDIIQHLTGNALDCIHARLPEGCGNASSCEDCGVLLSVAGTLRTGESLSAVPVMVVRENTDGPRAVALRLSTLRTGGMVMMRLDRQ